MSKSRCRARRRPGRALLSLESLESRNLFNVTPASAAGFGSLAFDPGAWNPSRILVQFQPGVAPNAGAILGGTSLGSALPLVNNLWTVRLGSGVSVETALAAFTHHPWVAQAQPDYRVHIAWNPSDEPLFPSLWGLNNTGQTGGTAGADIDAPEAWVAAPGNSGTVVAVIDTGVDYTHPDLAANMWVNADEIAGNGIDDDGNGYLDDVHGYNFVYNNGDPMDDHGHGTHVSGTIAAVDNSIGVIGVAPGVKIMALKFLDAFGYGYTSDAIRALDYAVDNGATISNNSWGGGEYDQLMYEAIYAAGAAGHVFVAAAGNSSSDNDAWPAYPASYDLPNILSVAATDHNDALAWFSNFGATTVDLGAPGDSILSTVPTSGELSDPSGYAYASGTSMATPHVTGVVALLRGLHPEWGFSEVIDQVRSSVDPVPSLAGITLTGGRLNAATAVGVDFGPRVIAQTPNGSTTGSVSSVQFTFSESVTDFTWEDISSFIGPNGTDLLPTITSVSGSGTTYTVSFPAQSTLGAYRMVIGPGIYDNAGQAMDQNRNGDPGEPAVPGGDPGDTYIAPFTITDQLTLPSTDTPAPIWSLYTTVSYLTINQHVTIADVNLQLDITFPNVYDLHIYMYSPRGTYVSLAYPYAWGPNFEDTIFDDEAATPIGAGAPPYSGSYRPETPLSAVDGEDAFGTWELRIDDFPYSGSFNDGWLNSWSVTIDPQGSSNQFPDAVNDAAATLEDTAVTIAVLANDTDPDNDALTITGVSQGTKGSVAINSNGTLTYAPNANATGTDTFQYTISDGNGGSDTAVVTVTINPVNDAPAGANKTVSTAANTAYTFVAADFGFSDPNDTPANAFAGVVVTTLPSAGTLALNGTPVTAGQSISAADIGAGRLRFSPAADTSGTPYASFTFQVRDNGGTADGGTDLDPTPNTLTMNVTAGNSPPVAVNDGYTAVEDIPLAISAAQGVLSNDTDNEDDLLSAVLVNGPAHGTMTLNADGSFSYLPAANYHGADSFTYRANDGTADSNVATVTLTISPVNDAPVAVNDGYTTAEDTPLTVVASGVLSNDSDVDGNPLTAVLVSGPAHGTLTLNADGSFSYLPAANYYGADSFTYRANDAALGSNIATVSITVTSVNDAPVAASDSYSVGAGEMLAPPAPGVLGNDTDADGPSLTAVLVDAPSHGALTLNSNGSFNYMPGAGFTGEDSFTYRAGDGTDQSNIATVTITVQSLEYYYFSATNGDTLGGVAFTDADILRLTVGAAGAQFSLFLDGSNVGLGGNQTGEDIDAFAFLDDGSIVLSTVGPFTVFTTYSSPGVGSGATLTGNGADLLQFRPASLGADATTGMWEFFFDGSDVGLSGSGENIDAVAVLDADRIVISTAGSFGAGGVGGQDEDLLAFTGSLGTADTSGTWEVYFDGSDVGLSELSSEDIDGLFVSDPDAPTLYFSTRGNFSVPRPGGGTAITGANEDVFAFLPASLGANTSGAFDPVFALDGSLYGLGGLDVDGFYLGVAPGESLAGSLGGSTALGASLAGVTTVTAASSTSLDAFASDGSSPAQHNLLPTPADIFSAVNAVPAPQVRTEQSQAPSAARMSATDYLFAQQQSQVDAVPLPGSAQDSGWTDAVAVPGEDLSAEALWAWLTYTST